MAINFGILQQLNSPQVMGSLPVNNQPSNANSLSSGIMQGMLQGQQMQKNNQDIQLGDIQLQNARQQQADSQTLRAAAQKGEDSYLSAQMQIDPSKAVEYKMHKAQTESLLATASKTKKEGDKIDLENYTAASNIYGTAAHAALAGQTPEQQQQIWMTQRERMPEYLKKNAPEQFSESWGVSSMVIAQQAAADFAAQEEAKKGAPDSVKSVNILQDKRRNLEASIKKAQAEGKDTTDLERVLNETNTEIQTKTTNRQTMAQDSYQIKFGEERGKQNAASLSKSETKIKDISNTSISIQAAKRDLKNVPKAAMNPITSILGLQKLVPSFQNFDQKIQDISLSIKDNRYNIGSGQGFSNKDAERLEAISKGGSGAYKETAQSALDFLDRALEYAKHQEYKNMDTIMKESGKDYDSWKASHPAPETSYFLGDSRFNMEAAKKKYPNLSEEEIVKQAGLTKYGN